MLKVLPSNIKDSAFPFSKDPAFVQAPEAPSEDADSATVEAYKKALKEHQHKWKVARETGDYSALRVAGTDEPTLFHLRPLSADAFTYLASHQPQDGAVLAFRYALKDVSNWSGFEMALTDHPKLGRIADLAAFDKAGVPGGFTVALAIELGNIVTTRASQLSPF